MSIVHTDLCMARSRTTTARTTKNTTDTPTTTSPKSTKTEDVDHLFSFHFQFFNPLRWLMRFLERLEKDKTGQITIKIPFIWYLTFLLLMFGGGGVLGASLIAPVQYLKGQLTERTVWANKPTPTPVVIVPTPAPVLVTRLGIIKATYQVQHLIPSPTPTPLSPTDSSRSSTLALTVTPDPVVSPIVRYVLMTDTYKLIYLKTPPDISLQRYIGMKALVTGYYTSTTNTIALDRLTDLEILY